MNELRGYLATLRAYWRTEKGRHDRNDDLRALFIISATAGAIYWLVRFFVDVV